jgi:hypothetical protein
MNAMTMLAAALLLATGPGAAGSAQAHDRGDRIGARREARFDRRH